MRASLNLPTCINSLSRILVRCAPSQSKIERSMHTAISQVTRAVAVAPDVASIATLHPSSDGHFMLTVLAFVSALIGLICSCLLVRERREKITLGLTSQDAQKRTEAELAFRDALLASADETIIVVPTKRERSFTANNIDNVQLHSCMRGRDAKKLSAAVEYLLDHAEPFTLTAVSADSRAVSVRGATVGQ